MAPRYIPLVAASILIVFFIAVPFFAASYVVTFLLLLLMYIILAESFDIVGGFMGYINLGHISFFGIGAYSFGIIFSQGYSIGIAFPAAVLTAAFFAAIMSYPLFRLRGDYFALGTFGLIKLLELLAFNLKSLTGGSDGLSIPSGYRVAQAYFAALALCLVTIFSVARMARSKFGLGLVSIREDEGVARSCGINVFKYKCLALILSSTFPAMMGAIYTWYIIYINPSSVFGLEAALVPVAMAMLGGMGTIIGPIVGASFLILVEELLWTKMGYLHLATYGVVLATVGLLMPGGIVRLKKLNSALYRAGLLEY